MFNGTRPRQVVEALQVRKLVKGWETALEDIDNRLISVRQTLYTPFTPNPPEQQSPMEVDLTAAATASTQQASQPSHHPSTQSNSSQPSKGHNKRNKRGQARRLLHLESQGYMLQPSPIPIDNTSNKAQALWSYKQRKTCGMEPLEAVTVVYYYDLNIEQIMGRRTLKDKSGTNPPTQEQFLTQYAPLIIERWALPIFKLAGFTPLRHDPIARSSIPDACCEICWSPHGLEDPSNASLDMYPCDVCERTYHWSCLTKLGCYIDTERPPSDPNQGWKCLACASLSDADIRRRSDDSRRKELIKVLWKPSWESAELSNKWPDFASRKLDFEYQQSHVDPSLPTPDQILSNLERQGFHIPNAGSTHQWQSTLGDTIRDLANFYMDPINPQADIKATNRCEARIATIDLAHPPPQTNLPARHPKSIAPRIISTPAALPTIYSREVASICNIDGKCIGMMTPERYHTLQAAFMNARLNGLHEGLQPPATCLNAEVLGLFMRHPGLAPTKTKQSKRVLDSYSRIHPHNISTALNKWCLVTKERMASPLDFNPAYTEYWSTSPRDRVFGAHHNALATQFTGFSMCHPPYDDKTMYASVRHALHSALAPTAPPTATFLILPSWQANSSNGYMTLCNAHPASCAILGTIPASKIEYTAPPFWINAPLELPKPSWSLHIVAVWNEAAQVELSATNPDWLDRLISDIPSATWHTSRHSPAQTSVPAAHARSPLSGATKFNHLRSDSHLTHAHQCAHKPSALLGYEPLALKIQDWKQWAYTDGSCIIVGEGDGKTQRIGAGLYDPLSQATHYINCGGHGMTNTINRAELTGIAAALAHKHTHIATDSACSLSQIRHQLLHPQRHQRHIHAQLLKSIVKSLEESPGPVCFYKVKSHTGIAGNECADAIAKHAALHDTGHDVTFPADGNPYAHLYWLAAEKKADMPGAAAAGGQGTSIDPQPNSKRPLHLLNLNKDLKKHMHQAHKLGMAKEDTTYFKSYKELRARANLEASNAFMSSPKHTWKEMRCTIQIRTGTLYTQQHALWFKHIVGPPLCPLCRQPDGIIHILSGCQHQMIRCQVTERHNIAGRLIYKALSKGSLGAGVVYTDIGSRERLEQQGLPAAAHNRTLPHWLIPNPTLRCRANALPSRPDLILVVPIKHKKVGIEARTRGGQLAAAIAAAARLAADEESAISAAAAKRWDASRLPPHEAHVHLVEIKYCEDTRPDAQLEAAKRQHKVLISSIRRKYRHTTLHVILLGVGGVIYKSYTDEPLLQLGLDRSGAAKLVHQLHTHAVQYASKIVRTRRGLEFAASASNPRDPH